MARYSSGSDPVHESYFADVLNVLAGPSPWQEYILPNLKIAKASRRSFRVLPAKQYMETTNEGPHTPGVTFKKDGSIFMLEWGREKTSYLSAVLHECVHWVSDPAKQGTEHSTAWDAMGAGILEGLVECVTEDILNAQGIELPAKSSQRGHQERVPIVRELLRCTSVPLFAKPLFHGDMTQYLMVMEFTFSPIGYKHIRNFAGANKTQLALSTIQEWRKREVARRAVAARVR